MENKIKILVGYHKPATLLKSEILVPIHLGRAVMNEQSKDAGLSNDDKEWLLSNMIGDNTGDNISYLNRYFCEMTGIYWAWKNYDKLGNPEYFGFMHYRRHFLFKNEVCLDVNTDVKYFNSISNEYLSYCCIFDNDKICKLLLECDIVHVAEYYGKTVYNQFNEDLCNEKYGLDSKIWDLFIDLFLQKFPHEKELFFNFLSTNKHVWYNMFIFKKSIFMSFCSWVFPVLFDLFDSIKCKELDVKGMRIIGFIAERLMSYYIFKHKNDYKVKKFQISFIMNTEIMQQKLFGARARAENYLQYKIGKALLNARNPLKAIILPITLYNINKKHKKELELNKSLVALNPNLKAPKIEEYADYNEAVKVMNNLPYKLGGLFIKHPIIFIFKARKFCKECKGGK